MSESLIERDEIVALLFNVSDIAVILVRIESCWRRTTVKKKKRTTDEDREARERALRNVEHTRKLAEKGQAELDRRKQDRAST